MENCPCFEPKECSELLAEHLANSNLPQGNPLKFDLGPNTEHLSVFNPAPIQTKNGVELWARVDEKTSESQSDVRLFARGKDDVWRFKENSPVFKHAQDPFYCGLVDGFHIMGMVETYDVPGSPHLGYHTVFYRYRNSAPKLFAVGPDSMKDIRIIEREPGKIGVFTRPQGEFGGRGEIGYFEIDKLKRLESALANHVALKNPKSLIPLFKKRIRGENDWGGANALYNLAGGKIGVLGHIANGMFQNGVKDYYPMATVFDPNTRSFEQMRIIATAEQFPVAQVKSSNLGSIGFSGGIIPIDDELVDLYMGIADSRSDKIVIPDPFLNYR